jgi:hypothetical protein
MKRSQETHIAFRQEGNRAYWRDCVAERECGLPRRFAPRNDEVKRGRNSETPAHSNVPNLQTLVIARAEGPWQSTSTIRRERAQLHPLAPLGGEGGPKGRVREPFLAERSDANFFHPSSRSNAQGKICGASRRNVCSLSRPCRGTLPRRAGEREAGGGAGGKSITQITVDGLPRAFGPRNDESFAVCGRNRRPLSSTLRRCADPHAARRFVKLFRREAPHRRPPGQA